MFFKPVMSFGNLSYVLLMNCVFEISIVFLRFQMFLSKLNSVLRFEMCFQV